MPTQLVYILAGKKINLLISPCFALGGRETTMFGDELISAYFPSRLTLILLFSNNLSKGG
jgi:hypothetical protein